MVVVEELEGPLDLVDGVAVDDLGCHVAVEVLVADELLGVGVVLLDHVEHGLLGHVEAEGPQRHLELVVVEVAVVVHVEERERLADLLLLLVEELHLGLSDAFVERHGGWDVVCVWCVCGSGSGSGGGPCCCCSEHGEQGNRERKGTEMRKEEKTQPDASHSCCHTLSGLHSQRHWATDSSCGCQPRDIRAGKTEWTTLTASILAAGSLSSSPQRPRIL